ncbi:hypothetical protein [Amycolatopsis magusensis]|uniref:SWIM-type domain-containing protein n=1 Tax=Amycolatopsis magusensis TaxID=882444 RepID=A0ABS4PNX1_9PSEU|nr:hypothetical protein [Amycolatopsis magusensis]MBP2181137.1 hypothetical protein [Amycolatopsis magusensis]
MSRPDLLALTPDALVALANRGLVKRAVKELDAGAVPVLDVADDGTLHGRFADGAEAVLPADKGFDGARCSCGAMGICRHRVGLVLAYQRQDPAGELVISSPGAITDEELTAAFGTRVLAAARRTHSAGYSARVRRPSAADPVAEVELPACTVRFLVPGELGYVHTEAAATKREQTIVLAVWAFRAADEHAPDVPEIRLDVGGTEAQTTSGLEPALALVDKILLEGAADASPVLLASLRRLHGELEEAELRWPAAAVAELAEQLDFHRARSAHYRARRFAELLTELHARHRAAIGGSSPRSRILGTDEPSETPLRRVRLTSLGCRISGVPGERLAELYFADARTASVLVLRHSWTVGAGEKCTGYDLAGQRISGTSLRCLASANVVSESAHRSASRVLRLVSARVGRTTTTPVGASWASLPDALVVRDYAAFAAELAALPPRIIRPRVAAELVRIVHIAEVRRLAYHPGDQRLDAEVTDATGTVATVSAHYSEYRPGALDALANALASRPRYLSGTVHRSAGALVIDPIAVLTPAGLTHPDLAPDVRDAPLRLAPEPPPDPVADALDLLASAAHTGLIRTAQRPTTSFTRVATVLSDAGFHQAATTLTTLRDALQTPAPPHLPATWLTAHLRLLLTSTHH